MIEKYIPYAKQYIDQDDIDAVTQALKNDFLTTGPTIGQFEQSIAKFTGARYAVALSNGTAALHAAAFAAGIGEGDEVITTPMTFAASANCVLYMGGKVVFCDIDERTYNIDVSAIEGHITPKTKAIIPVHYTGQPCDNDEIYKIARKYNLVVIEDAAHALGAQYKTRRIGCDADMAMFSFHPVKHITTGEGGMIVTNDYNYYKKLLMFRTHGIVRDPEILINNEGGWFYEQQALGYNYRLTDIQAALGISQLKKIDKFLERRRQIASMYNEAFKNVEEIVTPYQMEDGCSSWHLYVIQLGKNIPSNKRKYVFEQLHSRNIGVNVHYIPVYYHPYYQQLGYKKGICPNAEALYERLITLPLYYSLSDEQVRYVTENVIQIVRSI